VARKSKKKRTVKVNMKDVTTRRRVAAGKYRVGLQKLSLEEGDKAEYIKWEFAVLDGKSKGAPLWFITSLAENSLWNLRGVLEAGKMKVPDGKMELDLDDILSDYEQVGVEVEIDHEYDEKGRPQIIEIFPVEELNRVDDDDEDGDDDGDSSNGDDEEVTAEDIEDMSADELEEVVDNKNLDIELDDIKGLKKKRAAVIKALEGDDDEEETEKYEEDEINEMKKKQLKGIVEKHDLDDVDTSESVKDLRTSVIDALEEKDLMEE